ncbi:MAG: hypothetical protein ACON34_03430 [Flavobacteriales bacterium]
MTYEAIAESLAASHGTVSSQMFGKPCLKVGGKAFAAFFKDCMVFKLGREEMSLLLDQYPGSELWDPSGKSRPMKDWLQVPAEFSNDWEQLSNQALNFVGK